VTDNYETRLRARLGALEYAVPVSGETAEAPQPTHRGTSVRTALPVGSLLAAGLVALAVVGLVPRLAPAGAGAAPSASSTASDTVASPTASGLPASPIASLIAPTRRSSIANIDWTTVPLPAGVNLDTTIGNTTAHAEPMVAGLGGNLIMVSGYGVHSLNLTTHKWTKLADPEVFGAYPPIGGLIEDGRGGLMAFGSSGIFRSSDGRTWQHTMPRLPAEDFEILELTVTPTGYMATAVGLGAPYALVFTSADGAVWTRGQLPDAANWWPTQAFVWQGKLAIGAGWADPKGVEGPAPVIPTRVWLSSDGKSWEAKSVSTGFKYPRFMSLGDVTVAYDAFMDTRAKPVISTDLDGWQAVESPLPPASSLTSVVDIEQLGSDLVAVSQGGAVWTSGDGVSWQLMPSTGQPGWLSDASSETLRHVGSSLVYTNAKLPSGDPGLLIGTPEK
jgi:hypothetical protein